MNKKLAGIFAICALLLTGCQGAKESSKEITPPDTGWGKTVDEVLADWNLDRDQVEIFSETNSAAAIAVDTEATVFGEKTSVYQPRSDRSDGKTGIVRSRHHLPG